MDRFINRKEELGFLESQYTSFSSPFVVIYGRRRVGKTTLIREFIKNKKALYFLASEEMEIDNIKRFRDMLAELTGNLYLKNAEFRAWDDLFKILVQFQPETKKVIVIDEFQYLSKVNPAFPSIFQRIWDTILDGSNVMVILCGSLVSMMESQCLSYDSPLYGRRTGQIKLKPIDFVYYKEFYEDKTHDELIQYFSITGGIPKYIELFRNGKDIYQAIEKNILKRTSFLYEEPVFLLEKEVTETISYFSILKAIALGNRKLGNIASVLNVPTSQITKYLKTLIDLNVVERRIPLTEPNPHKSKKGLYYINDNFIDFWFKFVFPYRDQLEIDNVQYAMDKIKDDFISRHVSFVYEDVCRSLLNGMDKTGVLPLQLMKLGKWWDSNDEIDVVGIDETADRIIFGECKYTNTAIDADVYYNLLRKAKSVIWNNESRKEYYILFSRSGYSDRLLRLEQDTPNLILYKA